VLEGQPLGKYLIPADKFNTINFYGSVLGSNPVVVRAFDGKEWSDPKSFNITVVPSSNTGGVAITPGNGGSPSTTSPSPTPEQPISGKGVTIRTGASTDNNSSPEELENKIFEMALTYIFDEMKKNPEIFNSRLSKLSNSEVQLNIWDLWSLWEKWKDNYLLLLEGTSANYYKTYPGKLDFWNSLVDDKKEWDHKPNLEKKYREIYPNTDLWIKFPGDSEYEYFYDIWSNIHYGFVGKAIGIDILALQAGSILNDLPKGRIFDGPDFEAVKLGMMLWEQYGKNLTIDNFKAELLANKSKLSRRKR
jgi:hypothetical protein